MEQKHAACVERCLYDIYTMFGDERFKRYGCSEPGMFSDLVYREACQCDSKQDIISGKDWEYNKTLKKVGRTVYGSGDTIVTIKN